MNEPNQAHGELLARLLSSQDVERAASLSPEQRRLLMLMNMEPEMPVHRVSGYRLRGTLDVAALQQALAGLTRRHELLRSSFTELAGRVVRVVHPVGEARLVEHSPADDEPAEEFLARHTRADLDTPLDPFAGQLLRALLLRTSATEHLLLLTAHELIADEWTPDLLIRDLVAEYRRALPGSGDGGGETPAPAAASYADYARWRLERTEAPETARQLDHWRDRLAGVSVLQLPTDRRRPATKTYPGASVAATVPQAAAAGLDRLADRLGVTGDSVLLAAFQTLLSRYARQSDIAVGTRTSVRGERWQDLVGPAANTLVIRTDLSGEPGFEDAIRLTDRARTDAGAHAEILFGTLVDELQSSSRDVSRTPFFQAMFDFRDAQWSLTAPGLTVTPRALPAGRTAVDLSLQAVRDVEGLRLRLDYNTDLHDESTARRMLTHLTTLLHEAVHAPRQPVAELPLLDADEHELVLRTWNRTEEDFPADLGIHQLVEAQTERTPDALAVSCGGASVTYRELNERANQLAHHLRDRGVGTESRVAICLERSVEMVVAMLAVLKAGGAYVPLDPEYPAERLGYLLTDSDTQVLITQWELTQGLEFARERVLIDEDWPQVARSPRHNPGIEVDPAQLAYLIYTSGSTGRPKGVMLTHRGAVNNLTWRQRHWPLRADDRVLQNHSFSFDPSLWATFWPLLAGARVVITPPGQKYDAKALVRLLEEEEITVYAAVPSLNSVLMEEPGIERCTKLRYVQSGAEALTGALQRSIFSRIKNAELINFYGPTETTVDSTAWVCERAEDPEAAPIGRPVANLTAYILDDNAQPVPAGVAGHICIAGTGLARGYHGRPGLTADRFVPDPFGTPGQRLYRTGDLGRYTAVGTIEFLGRADTQVKIRGYRIELGEVETALTGHPEVRESVAVAREEANGDRRLIGYVARTRGSELRPHTLQTHLAESMPAYMVPSVIVVLDEFPKTPNGKIDRKALPAPGDAQTVDTDSLAQPRTELETEIAAMFAKALQLPAVGVDQDFFEAGGSSLMLSRLASQLINRFEIDLPVHQLFKTPTVEGVAAAVQEHQTGDLREALVDRQIRMLEKDAVLADDIRPDGLPQADYFDPRAVLLTGATGYLGAFLLQSLLERTKADVYCVVRANDKDRALQRLRRTMEKYLIWDERYAARIRALPGDLGRPRVGLSEETWAELATTIDAIYHSGATVNFVYPYSALRKPNVGGTQELLRLACTTRLKAFHHISTADVVLAAHMARPLMEDATALARPNDDPGGYTGSKWVAEKIVDIARERGIPVSIFRPGLILGHTATGATQPEDYLVVSFRGFAAMGIVPDYPRILDAVPVDYVADATVHISLRPDAIGDFYHLFNPAPVSIPRFCDWIRTFGYDFDIVPFEEARERALEVPPGHPLYSMVPLIRDAEADPQESLDPALIHLVQPELECRNTLRALEGSDVVCPPADEKQAHLVLQYLIDQGHLESPEEMRARYERSV
ncbi:amino acid adenylation domain-containing protein [Streptomyces albidoflavus]|uniref:non-ribosomal peptide synthetase n=2 Tax=Streptomyces TaxID=1883 RepID=UPI0020415BC0|nr:MULTISPECIES: non-ribosomal peptide synthetase [unclassified Streptomyces]